MQSPPRTDYPLSGKVVIVTGAGRGIGRAIATAFGAAGAAHVVCISRTKSEVDVTADIINKERHASVAAAGGSTASATGIGVPLVCDLSDITGIPGLVRDISRCVGGKPVDILVNSAGITRFEALECGTVNMALWQQVLTTNLTSPVALSLALLPFMLARGSGTIISIGSRSAAMDIPYASAYSVSKAALLKFHQNLQIEVGAKGILSFYLQPGNIDTGIMDGPGVTDKDSLHQIEGLRRMVERLSTGPKHNAERVGDACILLATDRDASLLSGLYVDLDGDIGSLVEDLKKGQDSTCVQRNLHRLKVETL